MKSIYLDAVSTARLGRGMELSGFEPLTLSMPLRCATNCAIAPSAYPIMPEKCGSVKFAGGVGGNVPVLGWKLTEESFVMARVRSPICPRFVPSPSLSLQTSPRAQSLAASCRNRRPTSGNEDGDRDGWCDRPPSHNLKTILKFRNGPASVG